MPINIYSLPIYSIFKYCWWFIWIRTVKMPSLISTLFIYEFIFVILKASKIDFVLIFLNWTNSLRYLRFNLVICASSFFSLRKTAEINFYGLWVHILMSPFFKSFWTLADITLFHIYGVEYVERLYI